MADAILMKGGGGGVGSEELTATKDKVLAGATYVGADTDDEAGTGTMPNQGAKTASLNAGGSYAIPAGYHNGAGKVTANSLASQTGGATAGDGDVLSGKTYWKDGAKRTGTMANQGAKTASLNAGGSYTIPAGYHNGSGKITANSLASQTSANAAAAQIRSGYTAWVNGVKITGSLNVQSALSFKAAATSQSTINITWTNPSKGPYSGVFIQMSTSGYPGSSGGTRVFTGIGWNANAGGASGCTLSGLSPLTTYYFTVTSYVTANGGSADIWGTPTNLSATTTKPKGQQVFTFGGTFTVPTKVTSVDVFLVSGGNGGKKYHQSSGDSTSYYPGTGGGGGITATYKGISVTPGQTFAVTVGAGGVANAYSGTNSRNKGGASYFGTYSAAHNTSTSVSPINGGSGGGWDGRYDDSDNRGFFRGGDGGSDGSDGYYWDNDYDNYGGQMVLGLGGKGQGTTTRAFGESGGTLYAGGGGGGASRTNNGGPGAGGNGGGGLGGDRDKSTAGSPGTPNTGGGGGGYAGDSGIGGSGIVIVRWGY